MRMVSDGILSVDGWMDGCMVGYMGIWVYGYMGIWVYGYMGVDGGYTCALARDEATRMVFSVR